MGRRRHNLLLHSRCQVARVLEEPSEQQNLRPLTRHAWTEKNRGGRIPPKRAMQGEYRPRSRRSRPPLIYKRNEERRRRQKDIVWRRRTQRILRQRLSKYSKHRLRSQSATSRDSN